MSLVERLGQVFDVFSRRNQVHGPGYKPATLSPQLRGRILLLYSDIIAGKLRLTHRVHPQDRSAEFFAQIHQALRLFYGRASLSQTRQPSDAHDVMAFTGECSAEDLFNFIEAGFKLDVSWHIFFDEYEFVDALNNIFRMEDAPFQLLHGVKREEQHERHTSTVRVSFPKIVRMDDQVAHTEAVLPALSALSDPAYAGADDEFRKALDDYRRGDFEDCLGKCGSAFESVLKVLCAKNGITPVPPKDTAGPMLDSLLTKSTLDTGTFKEPLVLVARMRNRLSSSHGGGCKGSKGRAPCRAVRRDRHRRGDPAPRSGFGLMPGDPQFSDDLDIAFVHPADPDVRIWRYMKPERFESFIRERGLFFTRIDRFHKSDPFEASIPRLEYERLEKEFEPVVLIAARQMTERYSMPRTMINCWHMNADESVAMWKLYCDPAGLCVQSTFARLSAALADKVRGIGMVSYLDYETGAMAHNHAFYSRFMHKRAAYAHEAEVRAVLLNRDGPLPEVGYMVPVDLSLLVDQILVAPGASDDMLHWTAGLVADAGLSVAVLPSRLEAKPRF